MAEPVSIRFKNPGALNKGSWMPAFPGYIGSQETTPGNVTAIFETHEDGLAAWWVLMHKYRASGHDTVREIIVRYGGAGQKAKYEAYARQITAWTGLTPGTVVNLDNDAQLIPFARAMFRYEAGVPSPLTDAQMREGFRRGRAFVGQKPAPEKPKGSPKPSAPTNPAPGVPEAPKAFLKTLWDRLRRK